MRFWDTSALIPLFVQEPRSETVQHIVQDDGDMVVWWATSIECASAAARARREGKLSTEQESVIRVRVDRAAECWNEIVPSDEARTLARRLLLRHPLRAADALQLAAALIWVGHKPEDCSFICLDRRLREAAQAEGFTVLPMQSVFEESIPLQ